MKFNRREFVGSLSAGLAAFSAAYRFPKGSSTAAAAEASPQNALRIVRITSNENPLGPSPQAREAAIQAAETWSRYPWQEADLLEAQLRQKFQFPGASAGTASEPELVLGIGSTEILRATAWGFSSEPGNLVEPHPSYSSLGAEAVRRPGSQIQRRIVPLNAKNQIDLAAMRKQVDDQTRLIMICNPNNPTGSTLSKESIEKFIADVPDSTLVFVDEAYIEFLPDCEKHSLVPSAMICPNVMVARTFSKIYGMAGMRVGYGIASRSVIDRIKPYLIGNFGPNAAGIKAARAALDDQDHILATRELNERTQLRFQKEFPRLGFKATPSDACFVWADIGTEAGPLVRFLQERGILITHGQRWDMPTHVRISLGTDEEMDRLFAALNEYHTRTA